MSDFSRTPPELYSEAQAAAALGISVARLHHLLDRYVFTGVYQRPHSIEFTSSDLLLLEYWSNLGVQDGESNVIAMPKRR